jgi:ferric-dicitrate binding protein FerR (iron transport regulator)
LSSTSSDKNSAGTRAQVQRAAGLWVVRTKSKGEQEITQQHIQQLHEARDEYQRMIEYFKAQG